MRLLSTAVSEILATCDSVTQLAEGTLRLTAQHFQSAVSRIEWSGADGRILRFTCDKRMDQSLAEKFNSEYLTPLALKTAQTSPPEPRLQRYKRGEQSMTLLAAPLIEPRSGTVRGTIATMISSDQQNAEVLLASLDGLAATASVALSTFQTPKPLASGPVPRAEAHQELSALSRASQFGSVREFAYTLVNSLANEIKAEQVCFGTCDGLRVKVEAVSGCSDFKPAGPAVAIVRQAMEECMDHGGPVMYQESAPDGRTTLRFIGPGQLQQRIPQSAVCRCVTERQSTALCPSGETPASLSARRNSQGLNLFSKNTEPQSASLKRRVSQRRFA